jgi:hypothetical protein
MKSVHFPQYGGIQTEQNLIQDLVDEQIRLFGMDVYYVPKEMLIDRSLNDVVLNIFKEAYLIEMMLINVEGFGGNSALSMSKFGLKITDEVTLAVSKRRWTNFTILNESTLVSNRPNEGDLIYMPLTNNTYEIKYVEREAPFYQLGKNYIYGLTCELLENGDNKFETGNPDIDTLTQEAHVFPVYVKTGGTGVYVEGEIVNQTYTIDGASIIVEGTVADWDQLNRKLRLTYIKGGVLRENLPLVGEDSGASWVIDNFSTIDFDLDNYDNAENKWYEDKADEIVDFTEGNPFGEFGDMEDSF